MKVRLLLAVIVSLAIIVSGCTPSTQPVAPPDASAEYEGESGDPQVETLHNAQNSLDWSGYYQGILPAATGMGIQVELSINHDGWFIFTSDYLVGDMQIPEIGHFVWSEQAVVESGTFEWDETGSIITLDISDRPPHFFVGEGTLTQLDMQGNPIEGEFADQYVLTQVEILHNIQNGSDWPVDWAGYYQGILPAATGMGIQVELSISYDGWFIFTSDYLVGDMQIPEIGNFVWSEQAVVESGTFEWDETGSVITLDISGWSPYFFVGEGTLIQLDMQGNPIEGEFADQYVLTRVEPS